MAREAVLKFNPEARIVAHHGNVKEAKFGMAFIRKFDLVLNALDNVDARRYGMESYMECFEWTVVGMQKNVRVKGKSEISVHQSLSLLSISLSTSILEVQGGCSIELELIFEGVSAAVMCLLCDSSSLSMSVW